MSEYAPEYVAARTVLLDVLEALGSQREAVIIVGAQAVYLRTGDAGIRSAAPYTTDADLVLAPAATNRRRHAPGCELPFRYPVNLERPYPFNEGRAAPRTLVTSRRWDHRLLPRARAGTPAPTLIRRGCWPEGAAGRAA